MYVHFSSIQVMEHKDLRNFDARVGGWLTYREAENCYMLGVPASLVAPNSTLAARAHMFSIEDRNKVVAVAILRRLHSADCVVRTKTIRQ